jgi:hypothetical protein
MAQFVQRLAGVAERAGIRFLADVAGRRRSGRYCGAMRSVPAEVAGVSGEPAVEMRNQQVTFAAVANIRAGKCRELLQIARFPDAGRVSPIREVGPSTVTIRSSNFADSALRLHTPVPTPVSVGRAKAASNPLGESTMGPLWIASSTRSRSSELRLMISSRNFRRLGSPRDRFVKQTTMRSRLDVLKTQMLDFGMTVEADICCQK